MSAAAVDFPEVPERQQQRDFGAHDANKQRAEQELLNGKNPSAFSGSARCVVHGSVRPAILGEPTT